LYFLILVKYREIFVLVQPINSFRINNSRCTEKASSKRPSFSLRLSSFKLREYACVYIPWVPFGKLKYTNIYHICISWLNSRKSHWITIIGLCSLPGILLYVLPEYPIIRYWRLILHYSIASIIFDAMIATIPCLFLFKKW